MFKQIRLKNYRTHIDTIVNLNDMTLIIGANNSGKSNLLSGINHFSKIVSRSYPENMQKKEVHNSDFYPYRHSLSDEKSSMHFSCLWKKEKYSIDYSIELYPGKNINKRFVACREQIEVYKNSNILISEKSGFDNPSKEINLRTILSEKQIEKELNLLITLFFRSLSFAFYYNFQASFLKGTAVPLRYNIGNQTLSPLLPLDFCKKHEKDKEKINIAIGIGEQGHNFQELVKYIKRHDELTYGRFRGYLQRFVQSFNGIVIDKNNAKWQFDMGGNNFPYYDANGVSDGLLKAGAIALICAMKYPPAIIMLEEVENGINQKNLTEFLSWLKSTSGINDTQFILTSHSPSVIREFNKDLDKVYKVDLKEKSGYKSTVTNLNDALSPLVNIGTIAEEAIIGYKDLDEKNKVVQIRAYELTELFYNGVLGNL